MLLSRKRSVLNVVKWCHSRHFLCSIVFLIDQGTWFLEILRRGFWTFQPHFTVLQTSKVSAVTKIYSKTKVCFIKSLQVYYNIRDVQKNNKKKLRRKLKVILHFSPFLLPFLLSSATTLPMMQTGSVFLRVNTDKSGAIMKPGACYPFITRRKRTIWKVGKWNIVTKHNYVCVRENVKLH